VYTSVLPSQGLFQQIYTVLLVIRPIRVSVVDTSVDFRYLRGSEIGMVIGDV
jgi:hypothetical protein